MITLKTKKDIAILREGGHRHAMILKKLADMVKPGATAAELNAKADELIKAAATSPHF